MAAAQTRHKLVALDAWLNVPPLDFDCEVVQYPNSTVDEIPERIRDATLIVVSGTPLPRKALEHAEKLQLVACNGVGTNHIDHGILREKNVTLVHVPSQNTDSVSQHAFALYFTLCRRIIPMQELVLEGEVWQSEVTMHRRFGPPPRTTGEQVLVIVGYGALGKNVEKIGQALGMTTLVAERKGAAQAREGRTPFAETLARGTLFILTAPYDASTHNMFGAAEFGAMDSSALLVNVGRGGLVNETELVDALRTGQIGGAATDVFEHEPATPENSPLLDRSIPNLVLSPHIAWYSSRTVKGTIATVQANLNAFGAGRPQNIVIAGQGCPTA